MAPHVEPGACHGNAGRIDWSLLSVDVIYNYGANRELLLSNIVLPTNALLCKDCNCTNDSHKVALNQLYDDVVAAITMASQNSIHTPGAKTIKKNTNSTQNKSETHHAKQYEVTSFLSTDCELSTETCSKKVYSLGP